MNDPTSPGYKSAMDLPSFIEMMNTLKGAKALTRFIARDKRKYFLDLEEKLKNIAYIVDRFYELLGDRNWIFHEFELDQIASLISISRSSDDMERNLIDHVYRNGETLERYIRKLVRFEEMRSRLDLVNKAQSDYKEGRFYAVVLVLVAVMDGFVNDLEPQNRRGLHAREEAEMVAWDSVVGHHKGLANAHRAFTRSSKKRIDTPVYDLHRNGIVHGNITNFNNIIIASKAWNRLFAIADWADAKRNRDAPKVPSPTWRELGNLILENARISTKLKNWRATVLTAESPEFTNHHAYQAATSLFTAWKHRRYGLMVEALPIELNDTYGNRLPGEIRKQYQDYNLKNFSIASLNFVAPSVCMVHVELQIDHTKHLAATRWIHQQKGSSDLAIEPDRGVWRLVLWSPSTFLNNNTNGEI